MTQNADHCAGVTTVTPSQPSLVGKLPAGKPRPKRLMAMRGRVNPDSSARPVSNSLICSIASKALTAKRRAPLLRA